MDREEIKKELTGLGLDFDGRWTTDKLFALLQEHQTVEPQAPDYTQEQINNIAKEVGGENKLTTEELVEKVGLHKVFGGEVKTASGLVVPPQIMAGMGKSRFQYRLEVLSDKANVFRVNPRGREEFVRVYSVELHGSEWQSLAKMFVDKNNK